MKQKILYPLLLLFVVYTGHTQDIALYEQFNGRYDFTFVGNTLNPAENNPTPACEIFTSSSAELTLNPDDEVIAAYLYWAGSGTGDFDIELNGTPITAERDFPLSALNTDGQTRAYFSAFADVTEQVQATGNGTYTVSELDLTTVVSNPLYCNIKTNFGGWAIIVFYYNPDLPLNQLNLYDGLEYVPPFINIVLPSLNVIDNEGAKIGFIAWEGDQSLAVTETLSINGNPLSNALNPVNNAFNGTNTVTGSNTLYNMDLDIYDIQDNIAIGDDTAEITLQSGQDFVMVNAIVTKLNSQLPDATIEIDNITRECNSGSVVLDYTVYNINSTDFLPAGTPIAFYINGNFIAGTATVGDIPIGGSESGSITINIPPGTPLEYEILVVVDDVGNGTGGIVTETDETNNSLIINETQYVSSPLQQPGNLTECDTGTGFGIFDFSAYEETLKNEATDIVTFYLSETDANVPQNPITNLSAFEATADPQEIFVRLENEQGCITIGSFLLITDDCLYPDGTITINDIIKTCNSRAVKILYTISNLDGQDILPVGTPIAIYNNGVLIGTTVTTQNIAIGASINSSINVTISGTLLDINITIAIDDTGNGTGIVTEIDETNNTSIPVADTLWASPDITIPLDDITECETDNGTTIGIFDFSGYIALLQENPTDTVTFHTSQADADSGDNDIANPENYTSDGTNPQTIYVRLENENGCYDTATFNLIVIDCLFPDGVIVVNDIAKSCDSRSITVNYTVLNPDSFDILPAGTSIAIYINGILLTTTVTTGDIAINGSETNTIVINIPDDVPLNFEITFVIDDTGNGSGTVQEINETNNFNNYNDTLWVSPVLQQPADLTECETDNGTNIGVFDFSGYIESLKNNPTDIVTFHATQADANTGDNDITNPENYTSNANPQTIYVRMEDENGCFTIGQFNLITTDCLFPDGTVSLGDIGKSCNSRVITVAYTINNFNAFDVLPSGTPVSIYVNGQFLDYTETLLDIAIGGTESGSITLTIPDNIPLDFELSFVVDDTGDGTGIVTELDETNNSTPVDFSLIVSPDIPQPDDITACDIGFGTGTFDFSEYEDLLKTTPDDTVYFYLTAADANQDSNRIYNTTAFTTESNPQQIFVRVDNGSCYNTSSFLLYTKKCPPTTYNYVTPNDDGYNDSFFVEGLRNIFFNFKMSIYNRWGSLVWTGNHSTKDWDAVATVEKVGPEGNTVPVGTYYFVLELNDPDYPEPIVGWVYVTK
ncbi:T9SS type B sorting domain-containing protein [Flavobacterium sp. LaA7.5]|nr:T9SS type B sorting domain-containing protein [Flavobacterium salilacus subsp. altitudinum]